jgi:hypothetical protein
MGHICCCCPGICVAKLWITAQKLWITGANCGKVAQLFDFVPPISGWLFCPNPKSGWDKNTSTRTPESLGFSPNFLHRPWNFLPEEMPSAWC